MESLLSLSVKSLITFLTFCGSYSSNDTMLLLLRAHVLSIVILFTFAAVHSYTPRWMTLPPTPSLPPATESGTIPVSGGAKIWYSFFGQPLKSTLAANRTPVVFLHGGLGSSDYFGNQIRDLLHLDITILS